MKRERVMFACHCRRRVKTRLLKSPERVRNATVAIDATFERHNTAVAYLVPHSGSLPRLGWTLNYRSDGGRGKKKNRDPIRSDYLQMACINCVR